MTSKPHSGLPKSDHPDVLTIYYGIHDGLRELGDVDADVGDTPKPPREAVVSGLWDADSALTRLFEQYQALESAARGVSDYFAHVGAEETDEIHQLAARLWTVLNSNPARKS